MASRDSSGRFVKGSGSSKSGASAGVQDIDKGWGPYAKFVSGLSPESALYVGVTGDKALKQDGDGATVAEVALFHEFGTEGTSVTSAEDKPGRFHFGLPERSFIRATLETEKAQHQALATKLMEKVMDNKMGLGQALDILGAKIASDIQRFIASNKVKPPSSEATNKAKGSTTTLVDKGPLKAAITWRTELSAKAKRDVFNK